MSLVSVALGLAVSAAMPSVSVESRIDAVTVFRHQALVVRRAETTVPLSGAPLRLTIAGLPPGLDEGTLQARCMGPARPTVIGVTLERAFAAETSDPEAKRLGDEVRALEERDRALADRLAILEERRHFIRSLRESYIRRVGQEDVKTDLKQWAEAQALVAQSLAALAVEQRGLEHERRELGRKIAATRKRAQELASKRATASRVAQLDLRARRGGAVVCQVRYLLPGVAWSSAYDVRLEDGVLALTHYGVVRNQSGEDWDTVQLALSTADPIRAVQVPELYPRIVRFHLPTATAAGGWRGDFKPRSLAANVPRGAVGEEADMARDQREEALFTQRGLHAVYTARSSATIPSNGAPRQVALATHQLRPDLLYIAAPRVAEGAYLTARARNAGKLPILAGEARLFLGDDFIGRTQLGTVVPGDELLFSFGRDERVRVERERLARHQRDIGVFTKETEISERYRMRIRNLTGRAIQVGLLDQLPISENEKIKVEIDADSTPRTPPQPKDRPGTLRWNLLLADGGGAEVQFGYTVRFPRGSVIVGL